MEGIINLTHEPNLAGAPFTEIYLDDFDPVPVLDISDGSISGWTISYISSESVPGGATSLGPAETFGDAIWANTNNVCNRAHLTDYVSGSADGDWIDMGVSGPPNRDFTLQAFSSGGSDRIMSYRVNDGAEVTLDIGDNDSAVAEVSGTTDGSGNATFQWRKVVSPASGGGALQAIRLLASDGPSLTITNEAAITPGATLTATASNFTAAPTTISLSDGASPALTPALTATASGDDYDLSALIADFKAQADSAGEGVAVQGLRIGTITATVE